MIAISAYIQGIKKLFEQKKLWFFFYAVLLLFGLLMILPIHGMILEHLGFPLDIGRDLGKFDYTQVADLLNNHGESIGIIFYQAKWIFLFYLLVSVILTSGLVNFYQQKKDDFLFSDFIRDALKYFWRFLRLNIYFLLIHAALLFLAIALYRGYIGSFSPFEIEDDSRLVSGFWIIVPIYVIIAFVLQIISDVAKFNIAQSDKGLISQAIIKAVKSVFGNFLKIVLFFLLHVIAYYLVYKFYHILKVMLSVESSIGFWLLIIIGQLFIFFRVGLRLIKFSGLAILHREQRL